MRNSPTCFSTSHLSRKNSTRVNDDKNVLPCISQLIVTRLLDLPHQHVLLLLLLQVWVASEMTCVRMIMMCCEGKYTGSCVVEESCPCLCCYITYGVVCRRRLGEVSFEMDDEGILDATLVPLGMLFLLAYQGFWFWRVRHAPLRTVLGVNHLARRYWVESIMKDNDKKNILAVQTLRNTIMGSTLMATTAILLCSATAVFMSSAYFGSRALLLGGRSERLLAVKYLALMGCFIFAFTCYMQSIRYVNHVNFLVNIPLPEALAIRVSPEYVAGVLARGCNFFTAGTRGFYLAFPLLLWLFSPVAVLCCCVALVPLLYYLDASDLESEEEFLQQKNNNSPVVVGLPRPLRSINVHNDGLSDEYWSSNSDIILKMRSASHLELGR